MALVFLVALVAGLWGFMAWQASSAGYPYTCADGTEFRVIPADDLGSVTLRATKIAAVLPGEELKSVPSNVGKMFVGGTTVFFGKGETVQLITAGTSTTCTPVPSQAGAPLNWGD